MSRTPLRIAQDALWMIAEVSDACPVNGFGTLDLIAARAALKARGVILGNIYGDAFLHATPAMGRLAKQALADMARAAAAEAAGGQERAAGAEPAKPEKRP